MLSAMILAAGRGERMRPLTDHTPKPLIRVAGRPLLGRHLENLEAAGVDEVVINHAWLGETLEAGAKAYWLGRSMPVRFSAEHALGLETAGGILKALPMLSDPFLLVNGDVFTEFDLKKAAQWARDLPETIDARLVLVPNPSHHPKGDFGCDKEGCITLDADIRYTFAGVSVLRHVLFKGFSPGGRLPLKDVLFPAIEAGRVDGHVTHDYWADVGTVERLQDLRNRYGDITRADQA